MGKKQVGEKTKKKIKGIWGEFRKFINRGNVVDMAVGVVIGGAFSAIVTSVVNVLLSVCTWGVPGGISGLITVLPAVNTTQEGLAGVGQSFAASDIAQKTIDFALQSDGVTITKGTEEFFNYQTQMLKSYNLYGTTYVYSGSSIINWGAIINAVISFLIIAIVLFVIVKVINTIREKAEKAAKAAKEKLIHNKEEEKPEETAEVVEEQKAE